MKAIQNPGRRHTEWILFLFLILALAAVGTSWRLTHRPPPSPSGQNYATRCAVLVQEADTLLQSVQGRLKPDKATFDLGKIKAPERAQMKERMPAVAVETPPQKITFHLRGIARHRTRPAAFIDERTVEVGEEIDGFKVLRIDNESVTFLDSQGRQRVVVLYGD